MKQPGPRLVTIKSTESYPVAIAPGNELIVWPQLFSWRRDSNFRAPKNKSGRGPPTSPTLRPRVLTPRDHFAHRGGGRRLIMHKSRFTCNQKRDLFLIFIVRSHTVISFSNTRYQVRWGETDSIACKSTITRSPSTKAPVPFSAT